MKTPPANRDRRVLLCGSLAAAGAALLPIPVRSHAGHQHGEEQVRVRRSLPYEFPDVTLLDADSEAIPVRTAFADKPVLLNFLFTTCETVCPTTSQVFAQVQDALGPESMSLHMVSVSIDPEQDTPRVLRAYGEKFHAGPQWKMLTGAVRDSLLVQRAFDVYRGDKMNHRPVTFVRGSARQPWVRLEGFATAAEIILEYRSVLPHA